MIYLHIDRRARLRYQQLMEEKELLNERWDEQNSLLVESHERLVQVMYCCIF